MAQKLTGMLNLSKIPKELLYETKSGDKAIFIDIIKKKDGEDKYGNTHTIVLYDKENRKNIFLGDLKVQEYGQQGGGKSNSSKQGDDNDLPF